MLQRMNCRALFFALLSALPCAAQEEVQFLFGQQVKPFIDPAGLRYSHFT